MFLYVRVYDIWNHRKEDFLLICQFLCNDFKKMETNCLLFCWKKIVWIFYMINLNFFERVHMKSCFYRF